jgi:hypothetical protein
MDVFASNLLLDFDTHLSAMTNPDKPVIDYLVEVAVDAKPYAVAVMTTLEMRILESPPDSKYALLCLFDAIVKYQNCKDTYFPLAERIVVRLFKSLWDSSPDKTRARKFIPTWDMLFSEATMASIKGIASGSVQVAPTPQASNPPPRSQHSRKATPSSLTPTAPPSQGLFAPPGLRRKPLSNPSRLSRQSKPCGQNSSRRRHFPPLPPRCLPWGRCLPPRRRLSPRRCRWGGGMLRRG